MTDQDIDRFGSYLKGLTLVFEREISPELCEVYFRALADMQIESVARAVDLAVQTCTFFPKPAELRGLVEGTPDDAASVAWTRLQEAYNRVGQGHSLLFEDGAIVEAMNRVFGGWAQLCEAMHPVFVTSDDVPLKEREQMLKERRNPDEAGRMVQVGGLSPEMIRARQKDFCAAYRQAVREGKGRQPAYVRGFHESNNRHRELTTGVPEEVGGRKVTRQPVYLQGAAGRFVEAEFDFYTWELLTPVVELLSRPVQRLSLPKVERKLLAGDAEYPMSAEEGRALVKASIADLAAAWRMPEPHKGLTPEEIAARKEELRKQLEAETLKEELSNRLEVTA